MAPFPQGPIGIARAAMTMEESEKEYRKGQIRYPNLTNTNLNIEF